MNGFADAIEWQYLRHSRNRKVDSIANHQGVVTDNKLEEGSKCQKNIVKMDSSSLCEKQEIRFVKKCGHCNVSHKNLSDKSKRFIADIFTTGVDLQWRWNLFVFSTTFVVSWLVFGGIFWLLSYLNGDFEEHPPNSAFKHCVNNLDPDSPFISTFLFSLETQTTIGYGLRVVTDECPLTIIMVVLQSVFGCILDAFMIGLIMAKISRPKRRAETLLFSRNAIINMRDGQLCLMFRVGNLRKSHLVEATIRVQYVYSRRTDEGEFIPLEQIDLNLDLKNDSDRLFLVTPQTICHPIDDSSPLWELRPTDLDTADFEITFLSMLISVLYLHRVSVKSLLSISCQLGRMNVNHCSYQIIVILEGMVEATGMTTQARASYLSSEILWGHRFQNIISLSRNNSYKVNFKRFHSTHYTPDGPRQSAKEISQVAAKIPLINEPNALSHKPGQPQKTNSTASDRSTPDRKDSIVDDGTSRPPNTLSINMEKPMDYHTTPSEAVKDEKPLEKLSPNSKRLPSHDVNSNHLHADCGIKPNRLETHETVSPLTETMYIHDIAGIPTSGKAQKCIGTLNGYFPRTSSDTELPVGQDHKKKSLSDMDQK